MRIAGSRKPKLEDILTAKGTWRSAKHSDGYTTTADFCRVFGESLGRLYTLAFLLTADHAQAERCFLAALDNCRADAPVFKDWAASYSARAIVKSAIQIVRSLEPERVNHSYTTTNFQSDGDMVGHALVSAIVSLRSFERLVYVLSVLERYSDRECSILLDVGIAEVVGARTQALQNVAAALTSVDFSQLKRGHGDELKNSERRNDHVDEWTFSRQKAD